MTGNYKRIPHYFKARSLDGLRALLLANNLKEQLEYSYEIKKIDNEWYAFYYEIVKENDPILTKAAGKI